MDPLELVDLQTDGRRIQGAEMGAGVGRWAAVLLLGQDAAVDTGAETLVHHPLYLALHEVVGAAVVPTGEPRPQGGRALRHLGVVGGETGTGTGITGVQTPGQDLEAPEGGSHDTTEPHVVLHSRLISCGCSACRRALGWACGLCICYLLSCLSGDRALIRRYSVLECILIVDISKVLDIRSVIYEMAIFASLCPSWGSRPSSP